MSNLTYLLLVNGRRSYSIRWLDFMVYQKTANNIYFADGSKSQHDCSNYSFFLKLRYKYFGEDKTVKIFIKKIINALEDIKTEYVMMCANDDFPIDDEITKSLNSLKKYQDVNCMKGPTMWLNLSPTDQLYGNIINIKNFQKNYKITKRLPIERIKCFLKEYSGSWHSIIKIDLLKKIMKYIYNKKMFDIYTLENFLNVIIVLSSKILRSKSYTILHQDHLDRLSHDKKKLKNNISSIYKNSKFIRHIENFCKLNNIDINIKDFKNEINNVFLNGLIKNRKKNISLNSKDKFKKYILKILDQSIGFKIYAKIKYYFFINTFEKILLKKYKISKFLKMNRVIH